jgi:hypothetical protein
VEDASGMRGSEASSDLRAILEGFARRDWPLLESVAQRLSFQQLEHNVVDAALHAHVVDGQDVRMIEGRHRHGFLLETPEATGLVFPGCGHDLERYLPPKARITRSVYLAHPPRAERSQDLIRADAAARGELH